MAPKSCRTKGPGHASLGAAVPALGNVAKRPVLNVLSGTHFGADVTLGLGEVHATTEELAKRHQANFRGGLTHGRTPSIPKKLKSTTLFGCARPRDN
ncbi:MAG TPA: hypothetical protein VHT48_06845 [Methylocella sp.]|nr:hypothetical protein [Methylocella sp.]